MPATEKALLHATALVVGDRGALLLGPSGSGKSAIASSLVDRAGWAGRFAALVSDDQCLIHRAGGRLLCSAPETLKGGIEIRGAGLFALPNEPSAVIHLVARLVEPGHSLRYPGEGGFDVEGLNIHCLDLPAGEINAACRAIESCLFRTRWPASLEW
ncbi:MAG: HPr kinase/phosphorylase [Phyllobacterium sp.]